MGDSVRFPQQNGQIYWGSLILSLEFHLTGILSPDVSECLWHREVNLPMSKTDTNFPGCGLYEYACDLALVPDGLG